MKLIHDLLDDFQDAEDEARRKQLEVQAELEKGQKDIAAGEDTTDDPLTDGIIVLYGKDLLLPDSKIEENYKRVAEQLKGRIGQPVVLIHRWVERVRRAGGQPIPVARSSASLGIIEREELVFDYETSTCAIPVSSLAHSRKVDEQLRFQSGDADEGLVVARPDITGLLTAPDIGTELDKSLKQNRLDLELQPTLGLSAFELGLPVITLAIGQDGIDKWISHDIISEFIMRSDLTRIRKLCQEIGIDPIEPSDEELKAFFADA